MPVLGVLVIKMGEGGQAPYIHNLCVTDTRELCATIIYRRFCGLNYNSGHKTCVGGRK
jgi:hypothetical protein